MSWFPLAFTQGDFPDTTNFLTRANAITTLDGTHTSAYKALINGLNSDFGNSLSTKLDFLYIFCTQSTGVAVLNLVSSSFTASLVGAPAFVADQGYTGVNASASVHIDTTFNASTAGGQFSQNKAHIGIWCNTVTTNNANIAVGVSTTSGTSCAIFPQFTDGKAYYRINDPPTGSGGTTVTNTQGYYVANRSGAAVQQGYKNAVDQSIVSVSSSTLSNGTMAILSNHVVGGAFGNGIGVQCSISHGGGSLSSTDVSNLYSRLGTFRTTVGLP